MTFLGANRFYYSLLHIILLYSFFTKLHCHNRISYLRNSSSSIDSIFYKPISFDLISSIEKKLGTDLSYKNQCYSETLRSYFLGLFYVDKEGKILGYRDISQDPLHNFNPYQRLNETFLHSTLFGSIKFIKI